MPKIERQDGEVEEQQQPLNSPSQSAPEEEAACPSRAHSSSSSSSSTTRGSGSSGRSSRSKSSKAPRPQKKDSKREGGGKEEPVPGGICRICLEEDALSNLETPCSCSGTQRYAHHACIQRWVEEKGNKRCEICETLYRGAYTVPPPQPSIPEHSPFGNGLIVVPAEVQLREAVAASQPGRSFFEGEIEEGDLYAQRHPGISWCFTFMVFFMFLVVLHHTLLVAGGYDYDDYDDGGDAADAPSAGDDGVPPVPSSTSPDMYNDDDWSSSLTLFILWVAVKALLIGIPLYIVMRIAARQAARERYEAMAQLSRPAGRLVFRFRNEPSPTLVRQGVV